MLFQNLNVTSNSNPVIIPQNLGIGESFWKIRSIDNYGGMQGVARFAYSQAPVVIIHVDI